MRADALAVDCPAREPDPVLLEQLSALAAASLPPVSKPWWQRITVKTGAAAVAGALLISGATADAEHGRPEPIVATIVGSPNHATPHHKPSKPSTNTGYSPVSPPVVGRMRHAGNKAQHSTHARNKKKQDGNGNGGGSQNEQGQVLSQRLATPLQASPVQDAQGHPHSHAHQHQRSNSQH